MSDEPIKNVVVTLGDPAGCGPQVSFKAIDSLIDRPIKFWVVGDKFIAEQFSQYHKIKDKIVFIDEATDKIEKVKKGSLSKISGQASLNYLNKALELIEKNNFNCLVTAPVSKEAIGLIRPGFVGHTEFLAGYFGSKKVAMMMASSKLRTVLLTRHVPLREAASLINKELVLDTLNLVYAFLKEKEGLLDPKIAIASFNPHAGIDTFVGKEEKAIGKAISKFGKKIYGPYPCDSLFTENNLKKFDCIIAVYHDQAMIPFKLLSFREGVNITLGLPIIRTSPDHGVAFDLVESSDDSIFYSSMQAAIIEAVRLSR